MASKLVDLFFEIFDDEASRKYGTFEHPEILIRILVGSGAVIVSAVLSTLGSSNELS
jgi:hypothetical protein